MQNHLPLREQPSSPQGSAKQEQLLWQQQLSWQDSQEQRRAASEALAHNSISL